MKTKAWKKVNKIKHNNNNANNKSKVKKQIKPSTRLSNHNTHAKNPAKN